MGVRGGEGGREEGGKGRIGFSSSSSSSSSSFLLLLPRSSSDSALCLPTDIHSLLVSKPFSSSSPLSPLLFFLLV